MLYTALSSALDIIAQVPDPGQGTKPPGSGGVEKILGWAAWVGVVVCVLGVIIAGATMAIQHRRGEGGESMARLGWVLGGTIVIGSASALIGALI